MKNPTDPSYLIYYMEVSTIKDMDTFLKALNNIESLAHYMYSDIWIESDLCRRYICVEVKDYKIRGHQKLERIL
jgi:hypothetical protein